MRLFYAPDLSTDHYKMEPQESKHAVKVLRMREGEEVRLVDGQGGFYKAEVVVADPKGCELKVLDKIEEYGKRSFRLHMAVAPTKNSNRFEWFLEKATEMGIDTITPLFTARSEKKKVRKDRLEKILIAAMKQSVKAYLPKLEDPQELGDFLDREFPEQKFVAHCAKKPEREKLVKACASGKDVVLLIGPEGDFHPEETKKAVEKGFTPVSLGDAILRTETAAVAACHTVNLLNDE